LSSKPQRGENTFGGATQSWAHHSDLVMYARRVLGDRSDTAEDVVQEAYLRLLGLAASDEAPTSARPWLFRVVRNLAIDERRSAGRRADPVADTAILGTASLDNTAELVEQREEIADAFRDIAALPPRERKALEMDQAGIGAQEIATELGTTPNAVHQALFRARKRLRNGRAVVWGLIPVGLAPLALRLSDPAMAVTFTNLPPGAPIGRALPVAGIVAAAMVGGSAVAPNVDPNPRSLQAIQFVKAAPATAQSSGNSGTSSGSNRATSNATPAAAKKAPSARSGPGANSGKGKSSGLDGADDNTGSGSRGKNRNRTQRSGGDDDKSDSGRSRRSGRDSGKTRSSGSGGDDDSASGSGSRKGRGKGAATGPPSVAPRDSGSSDDTPDEPDTPDDSTSGGDTP
jgi:RNA polymerase sigma factor (sigma-70 family)